MMIAADCFATVYGMDVWAWNHATGAPPHVRMDAYSLTRIVNANSTATVKMAILSGMRARQQHNTVWHMDV